MKKIISLIVLILILLTLILLIYFSCQPTDSQSIRSQSTYLGYKNIPELTIKVPDSTSCILFSDDGNDFLFWSRRKVYIYSLKNNRAILYKKIPLGQTANWLDNDIYYPLFSVSDQIPDSFKNFKNYAKNAKKYSQGKRSYPIVNYKQRITALNRDKSYEFYIPINSKERIYLNDVKAEGFSSSAMSAFDMNTWWTCRIYPNQDSKFEDESPYFIPQYNIWKNRNGKVSSFTITPSDLGMTEPDVGEDSAYISPSGKYVFIIYGTPIKHVSGRSLTFGDLVELFTNLFKFQKFYVAIVDVEKEKIILNKKFYSYTNYMPIYNRHFAVSEKRNILAYVEDEFIKFYHLNLSIGASQKNRNRRK